MVVHAWLSAEGMPRHKNHRHGVELTIFHGIELMDVCSRKRVPADANFIRTTFCESDLDFS